MKYSFVSYLGTDDFWPGILALNASLKQYNKNYGVVVLVSDLISDDVIRLLKLEKIAIKKIQEIKNPHTLENDTRNFKYMFTKLMAFDMIEFDKVVYLDADMLICDNIELLFECPHMSAVVAGRFFPGNEEWTGFNAGFMVIEPNHRLFSKLIEAVDILPSLDRGDQGFLHSFYEDWPTKSNLHLDYRYNVPSTYMDEYCKISGKVFQYKRKRLETNVAIIHFWGRYKPWEIDPKLLKRKSDVKWEQSLMLWWDIFLEASKNVNF